MDGTKWLLRALQMQSCSTNRHMLEEVREREKAAEAQMQRRRKLLEDSNMDAELRRLAKQNADLTAKASALRKVRTRPLCCCERMCEACVACTQAASCGIKE